jgi:hypothetical protein
MTRSMHSITCLLLAASFLLFSPGLLRADGGTVRLSHEEGNYQITVLTTPTPLRAGPIDISVLVQKAGTLELVSDEQVALKLTRRGDSGGSITQLATAEAATNKLFRAAHFELREPGWWDVDLSIDGPLGHADARAELPLAEPLPAWQALWPWFCWPALVIALFGAGEILLKAKRR